MLVGDAADDLSKKLGLETVANEYFTTTFRRTYWERTVQLDTKNAASDVGTVGAIILDSHEHLAAGGCTGGTTGKSRGRIGDTAVLGVGLYVNSRVGVVW
jgi:L-asparaginase / beta-aspartyl-peptidase